MGQITRKGAEYLLSNNLGDHILSLRLFSVYSGGTPDYEATDPTDYTLPNTSSGYANESIATGDWNSITSPASESVYIDADNAGSPYKFSFDGTNPEDEDAIIGYIIVISGWDGGNFVLAHESFPSFQPTDTGGDYIEITPQIGMS